MNTIQHVEENDSISMMIEIIMFTYARKVREEIGQLVKEHCFGCRHDHLSQKNHTCIMMSDIEHLNIYFEDAMDTICYKEVLNFCGK